jgi:hypothetical protein
MQNGLQKRKKGPTKPGTNVGPTDTKLKDTEWWYQKYFEYGLEHQGTFSLHRLVNWCRGKGYLAQEDSVPALRTLERWSTKEDWVGRRSKDLSELADRGVAQLQEGLQLRKVGRYRQLEKHVEDLWRHLKLCSMWPSRTTKSLVG